MVLMIVRKVLAVMCLIKEYVHTADFTFVEIFPWVWREAIFMFFAAA